MAIVGITGVTKPFLNQIKNVIFWMHCSAKKFNIFVGYHKCFCGIPPEFLYHLYEGKIYFTNVLYHVLMQWLYDINQFFRWDCELGHLACLLTIILNYLICNEFVYGTKTLFKSNLKFHLLNSLFSLQIWVFVKCRVQGQVGRGLKSGNRGAGQSGRRCLVNH